MKLTVRDKRLLLGLIIVLIIVIPYFILVRPMMDKSDVLEEELSTLKSRYNSLSAMNTNKDSYEEQTAQNIARKNEIINRFPASIEQEEVIKFIVELEENARVTIPIIGLTGNTASQITNDNVLGAGLTALMTSTSLSYSCHYEDFISLLAYLEGYSERLVVTSVSANYDLNTDTVSGTVILAQYALQSADRQPDVMTLPDIPTGAGNIFINNSSQVVKVNADEVTYDYFLQLSNPDAAVSEKIIGRSDDDNYLISTENSKEKINITVSGEDGLYSIQYSIGATVSEEYIYEPGESMDFMIISSPRVGNNDNVSAEMTWTNHTDMELNVYIVNDDLLNPRVINFGVTGNVNFFEN